MNEKPLDYSTLTKEQFDVEIEKGIADIKAGRVYSADEVEEEMKRDFKGLFIPVKKAARLISSCFSHD